MNINIKPINIENKNEINSYVKWENDLSLHHLTIPMRDKNSSKELVSIQSIVKSFRSNPDRAKNTFLIFDDTKPIGQISIHINPPHLYKKVEDTCWLGLTMGEKDYWGTGAAYEAMTLLEDLMKVRDIKRIELGVFEFNTRAQKFYTKLGYKKVGEVKDFTFWEGRFWNDIRMEKDLN